MRVILIQGGSGRLRRVLYMTRAREAYIWTTLPDPP
jgi:hypothetical protein